MKKVLVVPGAFQTVKNYGGYEGLDIWLQPCQSSMPIAEYYVGHSMGVNFILAHLESVRNGKFIFINPQVRKRNSLSLLKSWIQFVFKEGIKWKKITPASNWLFGIKELFKLLKIEVFNAMEKIPKENISVIRGNYDKYFCDKKSVEILKSMGIVVFETDAGHDWNENIAKMVESITG